MDARALDSLLVEQAGVISRDQALALGLSARQIDRRVAEGRWLRAFPGTYRLRAVAPTPEGEVRAAALWLPDAVLLGSGAGFWWDIVDTPPARWEFLIRGVAHLTPHHRVRVRRCFVDDRDVTSRRGLAVISRPLAVLRTAVEMERERRGAGITLIDRVKQRRLVTEMDLARAFRRNCGTWGTTTMRWLLERTGDDAHSELERLAVSLLRAAGITNFKPNLTIRLGNGRKTEIDIAFRRERIAIELDGFAYHSTPDAHRVDLRRMNDLLADGWRVRRFTFADLVEDPEAFVRTVRQLLVD